MHEGSVYCPKVYSEILTTTVVALLRFCLLQTLELPCSCWGQCTASLAWRSNDSSSKVNAQKDHPTDVARHFSSSHFKAFVLVAQRLHTTSQAWQTCGRFRYLP